METFIIEYIGSTQYNKFMKINNESDLLIIYDLYKNGIVGETYNSLICFYYGFYYESLKKWDLVEKYYLLAVDYNNSDAMNRLGLYYYMKEKYDFVIKYILMAVDNNNYESAGCLAHYYQFVEKNYFFVEKYYLMAINYDNSSSNADSMYYLAYFYNMDKKYDLMEKYYLMAINHDHARSMNNLAHYYEYKGNNYDLAKKYYLMAIKHGSIVALNNLGYYYEHREKQFDLAKKYYLMAIDHGNSTAMGNLARFYQLREINHDLMEKYYLMAAKKNHVLATTTCETIYSTISQKNINNAIYFYNFKNKLNDKYDAITIAINNNYMINNNHVIDYLQSMKISTLLSKYNNICINIKQVFMNYKQIMMFLWIVNRLTKCVPTNIKLVGISLLV